MELKISVIVPVYNVENYLCQCLNSLAAQTLPEIEFILVNDGSTDGSGEILREYVAAHARFKLIEQENRGYAGARNAAFPYAKGEFIGFVDSDDWIAPEMYETLYRLATEQNADVAECAFVRYFEKDKVSIRCGNDAQIGLLEKSGGRLKGAEALLFGFPVTWNRIYRRSMMEQHRIRFIETMTMGEDVCVFLHSLCVAKRIAATPKALYYYRNQRPGQQISFTDKRLFSFFIIFDEFAKFVREQELEYLEPWILHLRLSRYCYGYENASPEIRDEYFNHIRQALLEAGVTRNSPIAKGCIRYGDLFSRFRYLTLLALHPLTLRAILDNNQKRFNQIISLRLFLVNVPRKLKQHSKRKADL